MSSLRPVDRAFGVVEAPTELRAMTLRRMPSIPGRVKPRLPWLVVLLTLVTFGVYGLFWMYRVSSELRSATRDESVRPGLNVVLTLLTCSLYAFVVAFRLDGRIQDELARVASEHKRRYLDFVALVLLNVVLPGVGLLIAQALLQRDLNALAFATRRAHGHELAQ